MILETLDKVADLATQSLGQVFQGRNGRDFLTTFNEGDIDNGHSSFGSQTMLGKLVLGPKGFEVSAYDLSGFIHRATIPLKDVTQHIPLVYNTLSSTLPARVGNKYRKEGRL